MVSQLDQPVLVGPDHGFEAAMYTELSKMF
jgi:hypothetical protein